MDNVPPPANYDENLVRTPDVEPLAPLSRELLESSRREWLQRFASGLYGTIPDPPPDLHWSRTPLPDPYCERVALRMSDGSRLFEVDAALWLPPAASGPVPIIVGLDFTGPAGTLLSDAFPLDRQAIVARPLWAGGGHGPLEETMRGAASYRWPVPMILGAGFGLLTSCYGSWVPDDPIAWLQRGIGPFLGCDGSDTGPRAIALWAWALGRLIDVAAALPEIDSRRIATIGHSRLGKAVLWAAANDARIKAVMLNQSGCAGASLSQRNFGETLQHLRHTFPHWVLPESRWQAVGLDDLDQHHLLASVAPRAVYVGSAAQDLWADPRGEYLALRAALPAWAGSGSRWELPEASEVFRPGSSLSMGPLGWHLRPGGHDLLPHDWTHYLPHLRRILDKRDGAE